jgi:hypothetical protein
MNSSVYGEAAFMSDKNTFDIDSRKNTWLTAAAADEQAYAAFTERATATTISIGVVTHKPYRMPADRMYLPIQVGKAIHPDMDLGEQFAADNTGDNISDKNPYYSELTALYWFWKNCTADYKGLVHYRRHFGTRNLVKRLVAGDRFNRIATSHDVLALLRGTGNQAGVEIIVPKKRNYYIETIYSHYAHTLPVVQLDETKDIIAHHDSEYLPAFERVMASKAAHMFNMFIMNRKCFDEYCAWLFPILQELTERIDPSQYRSFNARYPGRISEMLLDVWLYTTCYSYAELPVTSPEPVNWLRKGTGFLTAKFKGKKYESSF